MRSKRARRLSAGAATAAVTLAAMSSSVVRAADTWTNASGNGLWTTAGNWADGTVPTPGDDVTFPLPAPGGTLTLPGVPTAANAQAKSLFFNDSYTLNSGTLVMPGAPINVGPAAAVATINTRISSTTGLAKTGNGTLVLGGDNSSSLSGDVHIHDGVLRYSSDANLGPTFNRLYIHDTLEIDSSFSSAKRMEPSGGTIRVTAGNTFTLTANDQFGFSSTDALYKDGPGTLVTLGHSSRFGPTYLLAGTTRLQQNGDFGYGPYILGSDATLEAGPITFGGGGFVQNHTTLGANSVFRATGNIQANNVFGQAGVAMNATLAAAPLMLFQVNLQNNPGSAASVFHVTGPGTVRLLNNALQYTGGWSVTNGTLRIGAPGALGSGTSPIPIASGGQLQIDNMPLGRALNLGDVSRVYGTGNSSLGGFLNVAAGADVTIGTISANDVVTLIGPADRLNGGTGGKLRINGPGRVHVAGPTQFAGDWWLTGGTLRIGHADSLGSAASNVVFGSDATLEIGPAMTFSRNIFLNDGTVRAFSGDTVITGTITVGAGARVSLATSGDSLTIGDGPNDVTFGGATGDSFIEIGPVSGPVILTHPNDVKATWVVKQHASLHVSDDAQLGPLVNTRPVTLDGTNAELRTLAPITTARGIVADAGIFNSNGFDSSYGNVTGGGGTFVKTGNGTLAVNHVRAYAMRVDVGTVKIKANGAAAGVSTLETVEVADRGRLDLTDNALVLRNQPAGSFNGTFYDGVHGLVTRGRAGGTWDGAAGIGTSGPDAQTGLTGLAVASAAQTNFAGSTFRGVSVAADDVIVMYTYLGDANLDGAITGDDYSNIDLGILFEGMDGYANGDFNYDGVITGDDYSVIDLNILLQGAPFPTGGTASALESSVTAVPEPSACGFALLAATVIARRPRRAGRR